MVSLLVLQAADALARDGAVRFDPSAQVLSGLDVGAWPRFAGAWDGLEVDPYVPGPRFRRRAYGRVSAVRDDAGWLILARVAGAFRQSDDLIPMYGGAARQFRAVDRELIEEEVLQRLVRVDLELVEHVEHVEPGARFDVGLHLIRVEARDDRLSPPAPEGRHRDGHLFVGMHLVAREGIDGGESRVYGGADAVTACLTTTLTSPLESIVIDDRKVFHEVSPISPTSIGTAGWRDMLLIDVDADTGDAPDDMVDVEALGRPEHRPGVPS